MSIFWDFLHQENLRPGPSTRRQADSAEQRANDALSATQRLHSRIDSLSLVNRAMWEMLQERLGFAEDELLQKVQEVDLRDGTLDGKARAGIKKCPGCEKVLSARHSKCIYCGAPVTEGSAFDKV